MNIQDQIFKWTALVVACAYLFVFWQGFQNGRYKFKEGGEGYAVLDTRTGEVHILSGSGWKDFPR